jgi:hypothetical protein
VENSKKKIQPKNKSQLLTWQRSLTVTEKTNKPAAKQGKVAAKKNEP